MVSQWENETRNTGLQTALDDPESKEEDEEQVQGERAEERGGGRRSKEAALLTESQTLLSCLVLRR